MHVARIVGGFFLLLQVVILVDFAHGLNEKWMSVPDESQPRYKALIVFVSLILLMGSGVVMVLCYLWWGDCPLQKFFISWTLIGEKATRPTLARRVADSIAFSRTFRFRSCCCSLPRHLHHAASLHQREVF